jgi:NTE family protein
VPGYFKPVVIDGRAFVDGGVHSPTNADVLRRRKLDLVIVVAPLAGAGGGWSLGTEVRRFAARRLRHEVAALEMFGARVRILAPRGPVVDVMGRDVMDRAVVADVVREAFLDAGEQVWDWDDAVRGLLRDADGRRLAKC